jgi:hypothetical protein
MLSSVLRSKRAIEVSIAPALQTATTPTHVGIAGNFPWYPLDFASMDHTAVPQDFKADALEYRSLMRTMGLARAISFRDTSAGMDPFHVPEGWSAPSNDEMGKMSGEVPAGELERLRARIAAIESSTSWRLTAPLRWLKSKFGANSAR